MTEDGTTNTREFEVIANMEDAECGRWEFDGVAIKCSICEEYALYSKEVVQQKSSYCPHCGANMSPSYASKKEGDAIIAGLMSGLMD